MPGLGNVLVTGQGHTLYTFSPEKGGKLACTGSCAKLWPPLTSSGQKPTLSSTAVHPALVASIAGPAGSTIITYAGWPLHTYASDTAPGDVKGQGIAGQWYVISPGGPIITKKAISATSSGSGGYGGAGY